jgi:uncharacterized protein (TIGR00268 family)
MLGTRDGENLIAFSGGVDSSLAAALVKVSFPNNSKCVIGKSRSLPAMQLDLARTVAKYIDIPLIEVTTGEGTSEEYLKNEGMSCYACKSHLYSALTDVHRQMIQMAAASGRTVVMFNGTNKDDLADQTRVGLIAAREYSVAAPLDELTKHEVRAISLELGLPNHAHAASPCLRSRLAHGVRATEDNLERIELAELVVRELINPGVEHNLRVRHMPNGSARIELDRGVLEGRAEVLPVVAERVAGLGFSGVTFQPFRSGSVAALAVGATTLSVTQSQSQSQLQSQSQKSQAQA